MEILLDSIPWSLKGEGKAGAVFCSPEGSPGIVWLCSNQPESFVTTDMSDTKLQVHEGAARGQSACLKISVSP